MHMVALARILLYHWLEQDAEPALQREDIPMLSAAVALCDLGMLPAAAPGGAEGRLHTLRGVELLEGLTAYQD